jgi:dTDP-4-amino-4,6-dideoxygalactose transaminase
VLLAQGSLSRLDELNRRRRHNYAILTEELDGCRAVQPIPTTPGAVRGGFLEYILRYDPEHVDGLRRDAFIAAAKAEGVPIARERYAAVGRRARLLHESPVFASQHPYALRDGRPPTAGPREQGPLPVTEALRGTLMTLPAFTEVSERFVRQCARALRKVAEAAGDATRPERVGEEVHT